MKIEQQTNMNDRTILLGIPEYDTIPSKIAIDDNYFNVLGVSLGTKPPYLSLEIQKTDMMLKGKEIVSD